MNARQADEVLASLGAQLLWHPSQVWVNHHVKYRDAQSAPVDNKQGWEYTVRIALMWRFVPRYLPRTRSGAALIAYYDVPGFTGRYQRRQGKRRYRRYCYGRFFSAVYSYVAMSVRNAKVSRCPRLQATPDRAKAVCEHHLVTGKWLGGKGYPRCKPRRKPTCKARSPKRYAARPYRESIKLCD